MERLNISFCRAMLRATMQDVRKAVSRETIRSAWVYEYGGRMGYEFQIPKCQEFPDGFYWYDTCDNAYEARQQGWSYALRDLESRKGVR